MWVKIVVGSVAAQPTATTAVAAAVVPTGASATSGTCTYTDNPGLVSQLYTLINNARAENDLPALTVNPKLAASARAHSIDMACHSLLSHTGSDNSTIKSRIAAQGYKYDYWNEAIYAQPPQYGGDAQAAVDWWLNDPPHRVILLTDQGTEFGAGYADVAVRWAATSRSTLVPPSIKNQTAVDASTAVCYLRPSREITICSVTTTS
jgi:uncharacterized protein YkwD